MAQGQAAFSALDAGLRFLVSQTWFPHAHFAVFPLIRAGPLMREAAQTLTSTRVIGYPIADMRTEHSPGGIE
jgi:hypothetical protein